MNIGDTVVWTSQSGGSVKTKTGEIVAIVMPGIDPLKVVPKGFKLKVPGSPRDHVSYLIRQGKRINLNWPVASLLRAPGALAEPLSSREYARQEGIVCPSCRLKGGVVGERFEPLNGHQAVRDCQCTKCGATWLENHQLIGYDSLVRG